MSLPPGTRLGPYEILAMLGAGGMGEVYRARDTRLGRSVAVKILPEAFAEDAERLRRFEQEGRTAGSLNHPGIVAIYDLGTQNGVAYLVLELLEGESLRAALAHGPLPVRKAVDYASQIARGLAAAHARGIVHRDLKPENLFLTGDGLIKILDFGLAKATATALDPHQPTGSLAFDAVQTEAGVVLGTIGYMSPEQLRGEAAGPRSDLFALGAVLHEMLTGRRAFAGRTAADTIGAILSSEPEDLLESGRSAPGLARIVARCLEKNPEERFQSAQDLAFALETLGGQPSAPSAAAAAAPARPRWSVFAATLAVGTALGAVAVAGLRSTSPPDAARAPVRFELTMPEGVAPARFAVAASLALSPDGRTLALIAVAGGRPALWLRAIADLEAVPVEGTDGAASPFWSPDGRYVGFFAGGHLKKVAAAGGPAQVLAEAAFGNAATWGADGTILFTEWGGGRAGLYRVSQDGGAPEAVELRTTEGPEVGIAWPRFLPDGRRFVYLSGAFGQGAERMIAVASLDSPLARHVGPADSHAIPIADGRILFMREGVLLAQSLDPDQARLLGDAAPIVDSVWFLRPTGSAEFSVSADGRALAVRGPPTPSRLVWIDREGREVGAVGAEGILDGPRLSPDGDRVAFDVFDPRTGVRNVWVEELSRGVRSRVTLDPFDSVAPVWSPDGERLLYGSSSQGRPLQMRIVRADGSGEAEDVLEAEHARIPQDWSPDGRSLLFVDISTTRQATRELWWLPVDGERQPVALEPAPVSRYDGAFSPDGGWVAFASEETGRPEVFITPLARSGRRRQISTAGGRSPRWRRDGRELFYLSLEGALMSVELGPGPDRAPSTPRLLFSGNFVGEAPYDVDRLGERFVASVGSARQPPIQVSLGWDARDGSR